MVLIESIVLDNCRLCHNKPGLYEINPDKKLIRDIYECVKVKVNDKLMDLLPQLPKESTPNEYCSPPEQGCEEKCKKQDLTVQNKAKYVCSWKNCKKILNSAYSLKTHELKHEGKRSFLCVTCGKGFITKNSLTCHEKIHLDVKGYTCKLCNIGFSVRSNLRAHEKKHHEGVRFYCSQCTKAFSSKCSLERHERIHTGIKEFQCESCPSAFYTNKELLKHQRYHQVGNLIKWKFQMKRQIR
ncbi:hypothetical protein MTP99_015446 [Tenebrio molitor]|nr:hypothetical protein MTP99_015446 [Tenebrio molitor]